MLDLSARRCARWRIVVEAVGSTQAVGGTEARAPRERWLWLSTVQTADASGNIPRPMAQYELFTDGACSGNPGPGGWAFILRGGGRTDETVESGAEPHTTNNRMELIGVIRGWEA